MQMIDHVMMVIAFLYPLTGVPQIVTVFTTQKAEGVSLVSWCGFLVVGVIYLFYALMHRLKPLIIAQAFWLIVDALVIVGVLLYGTN
jgi:uncharacterized protein with PQ loop repeat